MDEVLEMLANTTDTARVLTRAAGRKLRGVEQVEALRAGTLPKVAGAASVADIAEMEAESGA